MFVLQALIVVVVCSIVANAGSPTSKSVSGSIKDTSVSGLEGLNVKLAFPFKVKDFVVGFSHSLSNFNRGPENIFLGKSFKTGDVGSLSFDADYAVSKNVFTLASDWASEKLGFKLGLTATSVKPFVSDVSFSTDHDFQGKVTLGTKGSLEIASKKFAGEVSVKHDDTTFVIEGDSEEKNPRLKVVQVVDSSNTVAPSISLKTGDIKYGWTRKWNGGSLTGTLTPGDAIELDWRDNGVNGQWATKATIPVDDAKGTKVTIARDWKL